MYIPSGKTILFDAQGSANGSKNGGGGGKLMRTMTMAGGHGGKNRASMYTVTGRRMSKFERKQIELNAKKKESLIKSTDCRMSMG